MEPQVKASETLTVKSEADIYAAVGQGRLWAGQIGFEHADQTRIETIIAELARNAAKAFGARAYLIPSPAILGAGTSRALIDALVHGGGGTITLRWLERDGLPPNEAGTNGGEMSRQFGLEIIVEDYGPGITDLAQALAGGHSTRGGLGVGIPAVRRLADEFAIKSVPGRGTHVWACKWRRAVRPPSSGMGR